MNTFFWVSYFALWVVVALLLFALAVLARQIGLLYRRITPVGARMTNVGPEIDEVIPPRSAMDITGREIVVGGENSKGTLLVFMSPICTTCGDLMPGLRSLWKSERKHVNFLLVALTSPEDIHQRFIAEHHLEGIPYVISPELGQIYKVVSPPYSVFLSNAGVVKSKGITNNREHLESLINAADLNEPSVESYLRKRMAQSESEQIAPLA